MKTFYASIYIVGYSELIPKITNGTSSKKRQEYLSQIARQPPKFLAYLETYGEEDSLENLDSYYDLRDKMVQGFCSGSLVNSQYILT